MRGSTRSSASRARTRGSSLRSSEFRKEVQTRRASLKDARERQAEVVAERAAQKASIEARLAERQQLLSSVKDEIAQMQAEERRRQAALAAQARARLAAEQLAAQQALDAQDQSTYTPVDLGDIVIPVAPPPDGTRASQVIALALQHLGTPYVWGGASPSQGFDCSGLISYVYAQIGVSLPHHAASISTLRGPGRIRGPPAGRPRLLQRARPHGDVHRRRPVHPCPAYRATSSGSSTWPATPASSARAGFCSAQTRIPLARNSDRGTLKAAASQRLRLHFPDASVKSCTRTRSRPGSARSRRGGGA